MEQDEDRKGGAYVPRLRRRNIMSDGLKDVLGREQGKALEGRFWSERRKSHA